MRHFRGTNADTRRQAAQMHLRKMGKLLANTKTNIANVHRNSRRQSRIGKNTFAAHGGHCARFCDTLHCISMCFDAAVNHNAQRRGRAAVGKTCESFVARNRPHAPQLPNRLPMANAGRPTRYSYSQILQQKKRIRLNKLNKTRKTSTPASSRSRARCGASGDKSMEHESGVTSELLARRSCMACKVTGQGAGGGMPRAGAMSSRRSTKSHFPAVNKMAGISTATSPEPAN